MIFLALFGLWFAIICVVVFTIIKTGKGRSYCKLIWSSSKVKNFLLVIVGLFLVLVAFYVSLPVTVPEMVLPKNEFREYSQKVIGYLEEQGALSIDSSCNLENPIPELAYILPVLLNVYNQEVQKPSLPRLVRMDDTLVLSFDGYKQFKNRGILITRGVGKRLGPRYSVSIVSHGVNHALTVSYGGKPWGNEQLCGLPVMEASKQEGVDPALMMSIIRHISDFDFAYESSQGGFGLMALDSGVGLEQIFIGAKMLGEAIRNSKTLEDAVVQFCPVEDTPGFDLGWQRNPFKSTWVREVLNDIPFYENNGLYQELIEEP